jgi:hypothetical protein
MRKRERERERERERRGTHKGLLIKGNNLRFVGYSRLLVKYSCHTLSTFHSVIVEPVIKKIYS